MITLNPKDISFTTRDRRKRSKDNSFDLIHGVTCNTCSNVMFARFQTPKEINLWEFEQTAVLHTRSGEQYGNFNYSFPKEDTELGDSCYESIFTEGKTPKLSYQTIRLKNHVLEPDKISKSSADKYQVGERTCVNAGVVSIRKDLAIKTGLAMCGISLDNTNNWNFKDRTEEILAEMRTNGLREATSYGPVPIFGLIIPKERIQFSYYMYGTAKFNVL